MASRAITRMVWPSFEPVGFGRRMAIPFMLPIAVKRRRLRSVPLLRRAYRQTMLAGAAIEVEIGATRVDVPVPEVPVSIREWRQLLRDFDVDQIQQAREMRHGRSEGTDPSGG